MMGLPRLQPTRLCVHAGPKIMFFRVVSYKFPDKVLTQITTPATQLWYQMKALDQYVLFVSIEMMKLIIQYVSIKKPVNKIHIF